MHKLHSILRGTHGLSCAKSAGRFSRHSSLNDVIRRALSSAKVPAVLEPVGVMREDGRRPDGMSIIPWKNGKCMVWDATCTDTLAPSNIKLASKEAGSVAEMAASKKKNKYKNLVDQYIFVPMAVESMGPWCKEGKKFVQEVGSMLMEETGERRSLAFLCQRLSIVIQKGKPALWAQCQVGTVPMSEIFYL
uniref:Uncharacterized protein n=1 Tax=Cacopsylla melanoneura TaxID=428564 RepID=A0A8D9A2M9_9HEMI